jgi:hypothetical protein
MANMENTAGAATPTGAISSKASNADDLITETKPSHERVEQVEQVASRPWQKDDDKVADTVPSKGRAYWVAKILDAHRRSLGGIIDIGNTLIEAKDDLGHGEWLPMVDNDLPYGRKVAEQYMRVARHPRTSNSSNWTILPPILSTLVEIIKLSDEEFEKRKKDGTIHQEMTCKDVTSRIKPHNPPKLPSGETLLDEFVTLVRELKQSMEAGDITVDDIRRASSELMELLT